MTTTADEQNTNGQCSLREAIVNVNANDQSGSADCGAGGTTEDEIRFNPGGSAATITLASQLPAITDSAGLTITGAGGANITVSGNDQVRVFQVESGAKLTLDNLTVANGSAGGSVGGGMHNAGTLSVSNSTISGNSAGNAGGIQNDSTGTLTVSNSTVSGNQANFVGGIYNQGTVTVSNSTISNNRAFIETGGIYGAPGTTTTLKNTIVANNVQELGADCSGTITNGGYNLDSGTSCGFGTTNHSISGEDPLLGPLADNGGPTKTHALLEGSPAIDKGNSFGAFADQRGVSRPLGAASDIGAFEFMDTKKPTVIGLQPAATATGVSRGANVVATFSEKMQKSTLTNPANFKLYQRTATGTYIQITDVTLTVANVAGTQARLNPYGDSATRLARNTRYKAVVTTGVEDLAGNALAANKVWTFKTVS